jgi:3-hydroxyisobutyrate dehydrogenase-like beta-hydroxyacid dehydrogenase
VEIFERVRRVISSYARAVTLMGGPGAGQLTKMCKQICIAELIQALTEGLNFAQRAGGLDPKQVVDVIA